MPVTLRSLADAVDCIEPGMTVFIHGTATEPRRLVDRLAAHPGALTGVHLITSFIPGINTQTLIESGARLTTFMAQPALATALADGSAEALRLSYGALPDWLRALPRLDIAVLRGARADDETFSTGLTGELLAAAAQRATRRLLIDDPAMPRPAHGLDLPLRAYDALVTDAGPLIEYRGGDRVDETARAIARHVHRLVADGAVIQCGLGVVPAAVLDALSSRRGLRVFSGMVSDGLMRLADGGALADDVEHVYGMALGSDALYRWLDRRPGFSVAGCDDTHDRARLAATPGFTAINSAVEVDLAGRVNAEQLGDRVISGPGGLPDYAFGGARSAGGRSIVALPSSNRRRGLSRIVPRVANADAPTLTQADVTHVVTEHGVAEIAGVDDETRAQRLIAIADPDHREALTASLNR